MPKPLSLFIRAPFQPGDKPTGPWTRRLAYGDPLPPALLAHRGEVAEFVLLETANPSIGLYAAATGYLSTRFPADRIADLGESLACDMVADEPPSLLMYLNPRPFLDFIPGFSDRAGQLTSPLPTTTPGILDRYTTPPGFLNAFTYFNLDTQSVRNALQSQLNSLTVPPAATRLEQDRRWRLFLEGKVDIPVVSGQTVGAAGVAVIPPTAPGNRQAGFAVLGRDGTIDPSRWYDWMRDFVEEEPTLDDWIALVPTRWPLLGANLTAAQVVQQTRDVIYPFSALLEVARDSNLSPADWRQVGNNQKALYRRRLLQRTGQASAGDSAPPFEFNDTDWQNVFQIEAIVEYYKNFDDPWSILSTPIDPGAPDFIRVDLLPQQGTAAVPAGSQLTFINPPDFGRIWPGRDLIFLEDDTARPNHTYRIIDIAADDGRITLDAAPDLGVVGSTAWHITSRPSLVLIDPIGGRLSGTNATITATAPQVRIRLDVAAGTLDKINKHGFDTVYFHGDTRSNFRPRAYGIREADSATSTLVLDTAPTFPSGHSAWFLPASINGALPPLTYDLGVSAARGWDHYDGLMFVVYEGKVSDRFRFSSYTSHAQEKPEYLSSIRGNARYFCESIKSPNNFINFSFAVVDEDSMMFDHDRWTSGYDGVRENRFYFKLAVTGDTAQPGQNPSDGGTGKTGIRIHYGARNGPGTGSAGCIVSPLYFNMRAALIAIHRAEHGLIDPAKFDPRLNRIAETLALGANKALNAKLPAGVWNARITASLWLVRPDERPLS